MTDDEIVENFFMHGCTKPDGTPLPLRNCNKIHHLYSDELDQCCCGKFEHIYLKYKQRLYQFLEIEKEKNNK